MMSFEKTTDGLRTALNQGPNGRRYAIDALNRVHDVVAEVLEREGAKTRWEVKVLRDQSGDIASIETPYGEARIVRRAFLVEGMSVAQAVIEKKLVDPKGNIYWKPVWSLEGNSNLESLSNGEVVEIHQTLAPDVPMRVAADIIIAIGRCTE